MTPKAILLIKQLELSLSVGWTEEERKHKQLIVVDIQLNFLKPPAACQSDELQETVCYDHLIQQIREECTQKSFHLIEHLAQEIYTLVKRNIPTGIKINISVHKYPNVAQLNGGVFFHYGDE